MNRWIRVLSALLALLLLTACGKLPQAPTQETDVPVAEEEIVQEEEQMPQEELDLGVFAGIYRAKVPQEGDAGYVQITAHGDFLVLEHFLCMEGSVYSFWAEEFWPKEDGLSDEELVSVSGMSQTFSMMTAGDGYDTLPQNRVITLTDDGVVLNYDDSDAEYYVTDPDFSYHTTREELRQILGESAAKEQDALCGTWSWRNSRDAACVTFREDGSVSFREKKAGEPVQVYEGVFSLAERGCVTIAAEKAGDGNYPHIMDWQWHVDADNMLWLTLEDGRQIVFLPTEEKQPASIDRRAALTYVGSRFEQSGQYTDVNETAYDYTYRLPCFLGDAPETQTINGQIAEKYLPIIEEELRAMENGDFLSYTEVNWESNVYDGVLYLHIYATTWDWEEHSAYYYDVETGAFLTTEEVLDRLLIDQTYFLEAVGEYATAAFEETFAELPEEYREEYGYYDMLEWTASEEAVNLQLPIFVNGFGSIAVYAKIGSMAGAGIIWKVLYPFDGAVG